MKTQSHFKSSSENLSFAEVFSKVQNKINAKNITQNSDPTQNKNWNFSSEGRSTNSEIPLEFSIDPYEIPLNTSFTKLHFSWSTLSKKNSYKKLAEETKYQRQKREEELLKKQQIPHTLNPEQALALEVFKLFGVVLKPNFSEGELRKSYRKLCFKVHPDHQGSTEDFMKLKKSYEILSVLFLK